MLEDVKIRRDAQITLYPFTDYFQGFEKVGAVRKVFGRKTERVLRDLKVEFFSGRRGYMGVNNESGHMRVNALYLKEGDERGIYLDVIHELVHVNQHLNGRELFDERYEYVDRPTEIEAYKATVEEARRIGMTDEEIFHHLHMEMMTKAAHHRLARHVGIKAPRRSRKKLEYARGR